MRSPRRYLLSRMQPLQSPRNREGLGSMMLGTLSCGVGLLALSALLGANSSTGLRLSSLAMIATSHDPDGEPTAFVPAWWYVPSEGYWAVVFVGLLLGLGALRASRERGFPPFSMLGFAMNAILFPLGYLLLFTTDKYWG